MPEEKNKPLIWYVPGSGGQWINYLLWCLDQGRVLQGGFDHFKFSHVQQRDPDYFPLVEFVHHTDNFEQADVVLGSDRAWMNFYLNLVKKKNLAQDWQVVNLFMQDLQTQNIKFNLDWCDIWDDPVRFMQQLSLLTGLDLPYNYLVQKVMAQYSRTCVWLDPQQLANNRHLLLPKYQRLAAASIRSSYFYPRVMADPTQSGNYCSLIFNSVYVEKVNGAQVKLSSCCINHTSTATDQVDFANNSHLQQQRDTARRGLPVPGCMHCYDSTVNLQSSAIVTWLGKPVQHQHLRIQKMDYNVDPICNAKCIQCSAYYSSAWAAEDQQHGIAIAPRKFGQTRLSRPWQELDLEHIEHLYINGGEPLLSSEPQEILEYLAQQQKLPSLHFAFNTNGSVRPKPDLIKLWQRCRDLVINVSIDGTESEFNYIRYPLEWQEVASNVEFFAKIPGEIHVSIAYTVGIHNIDCVDRAQEWWKSVNAKLSRPMGFNVSLCSGPLDLGNAEPKLKQVWLERYTGSQPWHQTIRNALLGPVHIQHCTWLEHLTMIDQRRQTDWRLALPALHETWKLSQSSV